MGFLETLIPEALALIEKNKPKRILITVFDCHPECEFCTRVPTSDVEPIKIQVSLSKGSDTCLWVIRDLP